MVELDQFKYELSQLEPTLKEIKGSLNIDAKKSRISELNMYMEAPGFWEDVDKSQKISRELRELEDTLKKFDTLENTYEEIGILIEMGYEENDASVLPEIEEMLGAFRDELEELRIDMLLSDEYDGCSATVKLNAGAGGTESCDWAGMLYRMYTRWASSKGFSVEELDRLDGDEAGIKSVTFQVNGTNAYGLLRSENGVHRLVRISPFNAQAKRQTSFVGCEVMPVIEDDDADIEIKPEDIRIDTYHASGAGGQHINKTSSAIRITHFPTGIVVACQNERSQFQNKDKAMQMLKSRLLMLAEQEKEEKAAGIRGEVKENGWGSQIRSYVLQPYTMVKDTRTGEESGNAQAVLDGKIDNFISAYLKWKKTGVKSGDTSELE
ncbi:MAG: peptide chain release factor 2 [Lachnospiraceae bacterium]|nr:peptide chain release factor 2 [Lachnospiraceae bacterium]